MKKVKRSLALFLSVAMAATVLSGCGAPESEATSAPTVGADGELDHSPITLTIYSANAGAGMPGIQENELGEYWKEKFGITLDITQSQLVPDYESTMSAKLAGGDLPDIMWLNMNSDKGRELLTALQQAEAIYPLDDLIEQYGPDIKRDMQPRLEYARKYNNYVGDGKVYVLRMSGDAGEPSFRPTNGMYIRWDLYKELGYPKVETKFDLVEVLEDMVALEPETADGFKTYAVGTSTDWGLSWNINSITSWQSPEFFVQLGGDSMYMLDQDKIVRGYYTDPNSPFYTQGYKFFNQLYRKGLVDPDSFTQKFSDMETKVNAGRYMMVQHDWYAPVLDDPNMVFLPLGPEKGNDSYILSDPNPFGDSQYCYVITKNCKYPERAMEFLNYLCSPQGSIEYYNGIEGKDWFINEEGYPEMSDEMAVIRNSNDYDAFKQYGIQSMNQMGHHATAFCEEYNSPYDFKESPAAVKSRLDNPMIQDYLNFYQAETIMDVFKKDESLHFVGCNAFKTLLGEVPQEIQDITANVNSYLNENWPKLVMAESDEAYDAVVAQFITDLKELGVEEASDYLDPMYQQALDEYKALTAETN